MKRISDKTKYVGIDESNHGRFPEVFVAAISDYGCDVCETEAWTKTRKNIRNFPHGKHRDYTFLTAREIDAERIGKEKFIGTVIGSLLEQDLNSTNTNFLEIYLDGNHWTPDQQSYTVEYVSKLIEISKKDIKIHVGKAFDERLYLVHLADQRASIIKGWSLDKISKNKRQRELLE